MVKSDCHCPRTPTESLPHPILMYVVAGAIYKLRIGCGSDSVGVRGQWQSGFTKLQTLLLL